MSQFRSTRWNGWVYLAGFAPFAVLWQRTGVVWALLSGVLLVALVIAAQAVNRSRPQRIEA